MKTLKTWMENKMLSAQVRAANLRMRLQEVQGDSNLLSVVFISVVVIVVIVVIFFPQLTSLLKGVFKKAGDKLDSVWNYS